MYAPRSLPETDDYAVEFDNELILLVQQSLGMTKLWKIEGLIKRTYRISGRRIATQIGRHLDIPAPLAASFYLYVEAVAFKDSLRRWPRPLLWLRAGAWKRHDAIMNYVTPLVAEYRSGELWDRYLELKTAMSGTAGR